MPLTKIMNPLEWITNIMTLSQNIFGTFDQKAPEMIKQRMPSVFPSLSLADERIWLAVIRFLKGHPARPADAPHDWNDDFVVLHQFLAFLHPDEREAFRVVITGIPTKVTRVTKEEKAGNDKGKKEEKVKEASKSTTEIVEITEDDARVKFLEMLCELLREVGRVKVREMLFLDGAFGDNLAYKMREWRDWFRSTWEDMVDKAQRDLLAFFGVRSFAEITPDILEVRLRDLRNNYRRSLGLAPLRYGADGRPTTTFKERSRGGVGRSLLSVVFPFVRF